MKPMANHYLICGLYLLYLQSAVMAGEYNEEDGVVVNAMESISPEDTGPVSPTDNTKPVESLPAPSAEPTSKSLIENNESLYQSLKTESSSGPLNSYLPPNPGVSNPYPVPSSPYPDTFNLYPSLLVSSYTYPGHESTSSGHTDHSLYSDIQGAYPGSSPGHSFPSVLNPGFVATYSPPVSTDYVSRYQGPGTAPVVLPDGTLADTPEVIAARAAHLNALQRAQVLWYGPKDNGAYSPLKYAGPSTYPSPGSTEKLVSGTASHLGLAAGYAGSLTTGDQEHLSPGYHQGSLTSNLKAPVRTNYLGTPVTSYEGPLAMPIVLPSGYLADTPDVVGARLAHLSAVVKAHEQAALWRSNTQSTWR